MNIAIIGLGLIGGSIAKALSNNTQNNIYGFDKNTAATAMALRENAINHVLDLDNLTDIDVIYLCLYPQSAIDFTKKYLKRLKPDCIVTDSSGIKNFICKELYRLSQEQNFIFVGSHPMAGKEKKGFQFSDPDIFVGASYIITPCEAPDSSVKIISDLASDMGFSNIVISSPAQHDKLIAFTSQLPHILACAYVMSPQCKNHKGFSAGSYKDVSRVANINEKLWSQLFLDNKTYLLKEIDTLTQNIQRLQQAIISNDATRLQELLKRSRKIKEELDD